MTISPAPLAADAEIKKKKAAKQSHLRSFTVRTNSASISQQIACPFGQGSHRARRCAIIFESGWSGASSILIARAESSSFLNSARSRVAASTVFGKRNHWGGPSSPDSCTAHVRLSRARSIEPPPDNNSFSYFLLHIIRCNFRLQSVPIEIMKVGCRTLILNHFRLGHSGFNPHFGLNPTPTRWGGGTRPSTAKPVVDPKTT